ncbi:DUF6973 domain-containing protein [Actinomadura terrae]|uniref:DUF6973 domain-containing protein n=1 Tax=Actinomadura terrae TaxID=604353 RepID=UPI001FA7563F|nr:hypothetical protein [Actinomadura terrae]
MAMTEAISSFPLHTAIKRILDDPGSRPMLPGVDGGSPVGDQNFGDAARYDTGTSPAVALNAGNVLVEVHRSQASNTLWYHVGKVNGDEIDWGGSIEYDQGVTPSVAVTNDGVVVEVHRSQASNTLWYHVGRVNGDRIDWGGSIEYDQGITPSVAITDDGVVVEVHQSQGANTLWYHVGKVNGDRIDWGGSIEYDQGVTPSVAITNDGVVVEVHQSQGASTLWYHVGKVNGDRIDWGGSIEYDQGITPSVAITNDGLVVEVHQSQAGTTLWYRGTGQIDVDLITWKDEVSQHYTDGEAPKVTCNAQSAVETHQSSSNGLFYSTLTLPAIRSTWFDLHGRNSYAYCQCGNTDGPDQRHTSSHALTVEEGAPYLYVVLTRSVDNAEFPVGAVMTTTGPDGTVYDHDIQDDNQLVIMSGSSIQCLVIRNPMPGDWTMTMEVPAGVGFWCVCNTVPSQDVYPTMDSTAQLNRRFIATTTLLFAAGIGLLAAVWYKLHNSPQPATVAGLTAAMYGGLKPEDAAWVSKFMWDSSPSGPPSMVTRIYHEFITKLAQRLVDLANRLQTIGYPFTQLAEYVEWFGKNFSEEEYNVVRGSNVPVDRVLFVYALVYFEVRHMTDAEEQNAVRHALWQCYLKKAFGADFATQLGNAHEEARPGTEADNKADEINNTKGQQLADQVNAPYQCFDAARRMWARGELQKRTDLEGDPT